ncbi:Retrovirus-related Pol polyprotein from transposon TNT 1-94 [Colletotrichum higginsianum]|uniref:Retrovirus-related Pol polyprotein from transposon TNT 1-94 n=1 Tax=Colletotrichum higginsianum TaxID=80884 RepID=A0A4T0VN33_9PEZI|nr:Retrovirus-related Pol polyprotein from transposon TNT 1-94 [Colletotrichum higginsianum]
MAEIRALQGKYHLEGGEKLQWFLGLEILRDRATRRLWLSQAVYAEKCKKLLPTRADVLDDDSHKHTPMAKEELLPREGNAQPSEINRYQRKVGTILYAAVMTRPDVAFAASRLARFNQNPSEVHQKAADRVLRYLYKTRYLCLCFGAAPGSANDALEVASDASFGDNTLCRKSSQAFAMKLFGGLVAWRANKQDTVTTSTTEAELLALTQAAKEALFASRLISRLQVQLPSELGERATYASKEQKPTTIRIQCDNQQTVKLVTSELSKLRTKLRHVDIHNHWLRQEIAERRVDVAYTPSAELMANGLTKALDMTKHDAFIQQLNMTNEKVILESNRARDLAADEARLEAEMMKEDVWAVEEACDFPRAP